MDPLMERRTRAAEELANEAMKQTELMKSLTEPLRQLGAALEQLAYPPKPISVVATGPMSAVTQTDAVRWLRESEALLTGVEERRGIGRVGEVHSVPWRVARLIRWYEREHQQLNDILDALADATDLDRVKAEIADLLKDDGEPVPSGSLERAAEQARENLAGAWTELRGYVQNATTDGGEIEAARMLAYMDELRKRALSPVAEAARALKDGE